MTGGEANAFYPALAPDADTIAFVRSPRSP
jgi:hypothetical protein